MNIISVASYGLSAPRLAAPPSRSSEIGVAASAQAEPATRFTRTAAPATSDTYSDPRITAKTFTVTMRNLWAAPARSGDAISTLMANNRSMRSHGPNTTIYNLAEQWQGLGGALLRHLGATGEGYSQTRVNDPASFDDPAEIEALPPERLAQHMAALAAVQAASLAGAADGASTADLQLRLASGRTVQLRMTDNIGFGSIGMQVSVSASGTLSDEERSALQALADGLDRAIAGLGQPDTARLDLMGLLGYDRQVISGLDLTVNNAQQGGYLDRFELHSGVDKPSILLKGIEGEMRLSVDAATAATGAPAAQQAGALRSLLERVDAAGQRGQANVALVEQMKAALTQLQTAVATPATTGSPGPASASHAGLADFEASFSGDTWRENSSGTHRQGGSVAYQISQRTQGGGTGSIRQTVSEQLSADYREAPGDRMLNVANGNYTATQVRDRRSVTTLIESVADGAAKTSYQVDDQPHKAVTRFEGGHVVSRQVWPTPPAHQASSGF
ncbi:hypothetical protein [Roseateles sp.]|uniref:hypothetical protein n=1 Tax=Roseateles sp. TaxID=1971397 RepID=UPI003960F84A